MAIIGAVILGMEHDGARSAVPQHAANAIMVGFLLAALAFVTALVLGWRLLSHDRVTEDAPAIVATPISGGTS